MNRWRQLVFLIGWFLLICTLSGNAMNAGKQKRDKPVTVDQVDLTRYAGIWYEAARIPNRFQKKCTSNVTAEYKIRPDGRIDVINRCRNKKGTLTTARGIAKISDPASKAKLKVSFVRLLGAQLFWGKYWIIGLDSNYRYAVVGTPSRKYGWVLSRQPQLPDDDWNSVNIILTNQGYDPERFIKTEQDISDRK